MHPFGLHSRTRNRLAAIAGLMRRAGSIADPVTRELRTLALTREYLREVGRTC